VKFIEEKQDEPFLAYLSFYSVHTPLIAREDLKEKYKARKAERGLKAEWGEEGSRKVRMVQEHAVYGGMIEAMDQAVGEVLDALERLDLAEDTVVIFMSDNGGLSTSEGHPTSNLPLRAGKGWIYEGGIREPMVIRWPGVTEPGTVCEEPVMSTDFYPTMLEMAGLPLRPEQHLDGVSLVGLLEDGEAPEREAIYWHYPHYGNQGSAPAGAVRAGDWKLIEWYEDGALELYDLSSDIGEANDLADEHPGKVKKLHALLVAWREETGARMSSENPGFDPLKRAGR
jgi:arylsulfatase A-like enzyme